uniref:Uncharacterized protein n=1 Tax=Rhipicephalus zambeziensis TaxID=60191 RepID=A0A224YG09_9ACAR
MPREVALLAVISLANISQRSTTTSGHKSSVQQMPPAELSTGLCLLFGTAYGTSEMVQRTGTDMLTTISSQSIPSIFVFLQCTPWAGKMHIIRMNNTLLKY